MEFKCVHCGFKMKLLFIQYSPGNIRLMKCENCKEVADEYIECEIMILLIDLILQKRKAYSHLLFNTRDNVDFEGILWKLGVLHLLVDSCKILLLKECKDYWGSSRSFELSFLVLGKVLLGVILSNLAFICTLFLSTRILLTSFTEITSFKSVLLAIVVSSYFKIFLMAMMIWEFPSSVPYVIDILVLSSNAVALRVVTRSTTARCIFICFSAHAAKFLANRMLR
ncbi:hypothetical protein AQUCO_01700595v1 [Aquilegia coerulea]|uniref:Protein ARV n=1 Tax=Aquilegia coerulea TaxID=218851 RepID=A0A2G5DNR1_AQUCA|nr:hypothetical protein AQUCO_01700595v1 [Aquilegia coerulea]